MQMFPIKPLMEPNMAHFPKLWGCNQIFCSSYFNSFIHSGHFYSAPSSPLLLRGAPDYSTDTASEFHAEAHRQLQVKDLPKVLYMAARAGVEPTTLWLRVIASTNAPPCPTCMHIHTHTYITHAYTYA